MSKEMYYSAEKNIQIVLALLKANGIKKVIVSPGATNFTFVGSIQQDPWFEIYSSVDERSAAYMACGIAAESGEPVVLSCTGSTASRNYYPGLTEAYHRKLPILAITSHQGVDKIGQLIPQNIDRRRIANDIAKISVELPIVKDARDEAYAVMEANKAILELRHNGCGPAHINLITTYSSDFSVRELPKVKVMRRFQAWDKLPEMPQGKVGVFVGCHVKFTKAQEMALDRFCATHDAIVFCDHTSGYYGKYKLLPTLAQFQTEASSPLEKLDLMIHIGEVSAASFAGHFGAKEIWRVSEDGELRDPFKKLTNVFQMPEEFFFLHYSKEGLNNHKFIDHSREVCEAIYASIPELPFSNMWIAQQLSDKLPTGSVFHISASNSRRSWNIFHLPEGVESSSNVGCCGIDGATSSLIGASLMNPQRHYYLVTGDLAFFYDLNVLGNRHVGKNVRILLINNGIGAEFKINQASFLGDDVNSYIAAQGHFGNKSSKLVRHYAEDLGFRYLSASTKEDFLSAMEDFTNSTIGEESIILECFTNHQDERGAVDIMQRLVVDTKVRLKKMAKNVLGKENVEKIKKVIR